MWGPRKEVYERLHPEAVSVTQRDGPGRGHKNDRQNGKRFTKDAAVRTGKSERSIQRSATWAKRIPANVLQTIAGTAIDKGDELGYEVHIDRKLERCSATNW